MEDCLLIAHYYYIYSYFHITKVKLPWNLSGGNYCDCFTILIFILYRVVQLVLFKENVLLTSSCYRMNYFYLPSPVIIESDKRMTVVFLVTAIEVIISWSILLIISHHVVVGEQN